MTFMNFVAGCDIRLTNAANKIISWLWSYNFNATQQWTCKAISEWKTLWYAKPCKILFEVYVWDCLTHSRLMFCDICWLWVTMTQKCRSGSKENIGIWIRLSTLIILQQLYYGCILRRRFVLIILVHARRFTGHS